METHTYKVFTRTWWKRNPTWPNGLEPHCGRKTTLRRGLTRSEAQSFCSSYNDTNDPGRYSKKAEFEQE